jgi:hypothetical protein
MTLKSIADYAESVTGVPCAVERLDDLRFRVKVRGSVSAQDRYDIVEGLRGRLSPPEASVVVDEDWS